MYVPLAGASSRRLPFAAPSRCLVSLTVEELVAAVGETGEVLGAEGEPDRVTARQASRSSRFVGIFDSPCQEPATTQDP